MTTGINFNQIPSTVNVPLFYLEINSTATVNPRTQLGTLIFGISTGDADIEGEVISVGSAAQANELYGEGSQLATMVEAYRANDRYGPLNCIGLKEGAAFRAASKLVKFEGTPIENGSIVMYVGGRRISVPVVRGRKLYTGMSTDPGALDSIEEYVNGQESYPFTAVAGGDDGDQELYIPLPVHANDLTDQDITGNKKFTYESDTDDMYEHREPGSFIQPGAKYKKDPRNTDSSSIYYVPSTHGSYSKINSAEYTTGELVLINKNDEDGYVINRNNTKGSEWDACDYDSGFGLDIKLTAEASSTKDANNQMKLTINTLSYNVLRSWLGISADADVTKISLLTNVGTDNFAIEETDTLPTTAFPSAGLVFDGAVTGTYVVDTSYNVAIQAYDGSDTVGKQVSIGSFTTAADLANAASFTNIDTIRTDTISPINYPGDVNDSDEFYVPLPVHTDAFVSDDATDVSFDTTSGEDDYEHKLPEDFIQPGGRYKLDPRNSSSSSTYYVPSSNAAYGDIDSNEYTAPSIIAVNVHDSGTSAPNNPNYRNSGGTDWDTLVYSDAFDHDATVDKDNYPGDPPASLGSGENDTTGDKYFMNSETNRRGLVRWLLAYNYVLFTTKWQGADANDYDVRGSINPTESFPKGLSVIGLNENFSGGSGKLSDLGDDWDALLKSLSDSEYLLMVTPESGKLLSNLGYGDYKRFFDSLTDRWDYISQLYGHGLGAIVGNYGESDVILNNFFDTAAFSSFYFGNTPTPAWECVSALAGAMINQVRGNPKLPYNNIEIKGVLPPSVKDRPSYLLRERLLRAGISTTKSSGSKIYIERPVTGDPKWRDLSRRLSAAYIAVDVRDYVISQVGRSVIADEGTIALPGSGVVTPPTIKSVISTRINSLVSRGFIENFNDSDVSVLRDIDDPTRVNIGIAVDPTNPLYVLASRLDVGN